MLPPHLTMSGVVSRVLAGAIDLDRGLLHTFIELSRRPGTVARDYARGCTVPYTNPVKYFLLAVAFAQIIALWSDAATSIAGGALEGMRETGTDGRGAEYAVPFEVEQGARFFVEYFVAFCAPVVLLLAVGGWVAFRGMQRSYAEHLVFSLFVAAQLLIIFGILLPPMNEASSSTSFIILFFGVAALYYAASARAFFSLSWRVSVRRSAAARAFTVAAWFLSMVIAYAFFVSHLPEQVH